MTIYGALFIQGSITSVIPFPLCNLVRSAQWAFTYPNSSLPPQSFLDKGAKDQKVSDLSYINQRKNLNTLTQTGALSTTLGHLSSPDSPLARLLSAGPVG